jgi:hypothetical protein
MLRLDVAFARTLQATKRHLNEIKMTKDKKRGIRITTPLGQALYAYLDTPDTKFSEEGFYTITLRLPVSEGGALRDQIYALQQEQVEFEKLAGKKPTLMTIPIKDFIDEDGTECYDFRFKMKPSYKSAKTGEQVKNSPKVFDAQLKPMTDKVGRGSKVKVNFIADKYTCPLGVGVAMRLSAVQVIDLVAVGSNDGEGFGFAAEEGFVSTAPEEEASTDTADATSGSEVEETATDGSDF